MGKFLSDMIGLGVEALIEYPSSKKKTLKAKEELEKLVVNNEELDIEKFIEMLDVEYDEDDLDEMQGVREVYERSNKTLQNKIVIAGYVLYNDRKTNDCYDYTGNHRENESLQRLYDGLITIGYEMSDEELAMMDGTHELYTAEDE